VALVPQQHRLLLDGRLVVRSRRGQGAKPRGTRAGEEEKISVPSRFHRNPPGSVVGRRPNNCLPAASAPVGHTFASPTTRTRTHTQTPGRTRTPRSQARTATTARTTVCPGAFPRHDHPAPSSDPTNTPQTNRTRSSDASGRTPSSLPSAIESQAYRPQMFCGTATGERRLPRCRID
jgi:hypothetical protein